MPFKTKYLNNEFYLASVPAESIQTSPTRIGRGQQSAVCLPTGRALWGSPCEGPGCTLSIRIALANGLEQPLALGQIDE